jgi:hypothetical protein
MKKIISLMTLALFCMGAQCQGTLKKDPEVLYQCIILKANEPSEDGTWTDENGNVITGAWTYYYEVPIRYVGSNDSQHAYGFIENENNALMACEDSGPEGRGKCFPQDVIEGLAGHDYIVLIGLIGDSSDKLNVLYPKGGKIEACRKLKAFNGLGADQKRKSPTTVEKYNSRFGQGSSECRLALVSGPPTCGGF